jgi:predicted esterase
VPAPHTHHLRVQRTARYYTLGGGSSPSNVWVVLHGYGQLAGEFIKFFGNVATDDRLIVAPEAMNRFYLVQPEKVVAKDRPVGATWMTREDRASEIADYVEYLDGLHDELIAAHVNAGARVHVVGFSQGAATAARWVEHGHTQIDRLILWGGILPPEMHLTGATLRGVPITYVVGVRDQHITPDVWEIERARLVGAGVDFRLVNFDGGHVISRRVFPQLTEDDQG